MRVQQLMSLYIEACETREFRGRYGLLKYHRSPLQHIRELHKHSDTYPQMLPPEVYRPIFGTINPELVERLQWIWTQSMPNDARRNLYMALSRHLDDPTLRGHTTLLPAALKPYAYWRKPQEVP